MRKLEWAREGKRRVGGRTSGFRGIRVGGVGESVSGGTRRTAKDGWQVRSRAATLILDIVALTIFL